MHECIEIWQRQSRRPVFRHATFPMALVVEAVMALIGFGSVTESAEPDNVAFFREKIEPVLKTECYSCHSRDAKEVQGGLRLDSREGILRGGDSGPAIVPGKSGDSLLIQAIRHANGLAMPPKKDKLPESTLAHFTKWIDDGATDPRLDSSVGSDPMGLQAARKHWALQPVKLIPAPVCDDDSSCVSGIDCFIQRKLEENQLSQAPQASRRELIRRLTFDLTGIPPNIEDVDEFLNDASPDACERVVDRLLSSWQYGERWAQHWLDVVRYAETEGYEYDRPVPDAWRFRDYVIDSLNRDKPFDRFVVEQIAGDEIAPEDNECLTASIFHRIGPVRRNAGNPEIALSRNEVLTERTDIIGAAFLGLTVGCARCHNHKLEPISQKDYYRLQAYLSATEDHNISLATADQTRIWETETKRIKDEMQRLKVRARLLTGKEKDELDAMIEELEDQLPPSLPTIPSTRNDFQKQTAIHVLKRGVWENKGELVGARPVSVLVADEVPEFLPNIPNPRTQLARWLISPDNPLTARVIVNRIWQHHFGIGLVKTANDFGLKGERPSHPELLDWLTNRFIQNGWRWKPLHREIVLSATYRQSSRPTNRKLADRVDPENRLLSHFTRRRLSAEEIRDSMLAVSGRLNLSAGGPSVVIRVDTELVQLLYKPSQWTVSSNSGDHDKRSVYLIAKRNLRLPFMENLDAPTLQASCARRESSTHAPQALELLNGRLSNDLAKSFAERLHRECGDDSPHTVETAFQLALGRSPTEREKERSLNFLREQPPSEFALALFNLNEFLYVP